MNFNVADLFESAVDVIPDHLALVGGQERLTYRELDERANRLANHLLDSNLPRGAFVGVLARNRVEWLETMIGCFKAATVPINLNYRYVAPELRYVAENAELGALVYERSFTELVASACSDLPVECQFLALDDGISRAGSLSESALGAIEYEKALASASPDRGRLPQKSGDDLYVLYTGGTTGLPKGVVWRQEDLYLGPLGGAAHRGGPATSLEQFAHRLQVAESRQTALVIPPLMHGTGQWMSLGTLLSGGTSVLYTEPRFSAKSVWGLVDQELVTLLVMVGDVMGRPLVEAHSDEINGSSLSTLVTSGAPLSASVRSELLAILPHLRIINRLGSSESGTVGTASATEQIPGSTNGQFSVSDDTRVLDDELRPLAPGDGRTGRLARRGFIPLGYYKDPAKTKATFVVDAEGERWVLPGDLATVLEHGQIQLLGRGSATINSGGEKIFPQEVEAALKSHPAVSGAIVVGVPDDHFGQAVAAVIQARNGASPTLDELNEHCRSVIAGFKLPRRVVMVDELPLTVVGKPDILAAAALFG